MARTITTTAGTPIDLDGDVLAIIEAISRDLTRQRKLDYGFEDAPATLTSITSSPTSVADHVSASSMNTTGLSSRMAAISMPFASRGVEGITTLRPGMWANHECSALLCW